MFDLDLIDNPTRLAADLLAHIAAEIDPAAVVFPSRYAHEPKGQRHDFAADTSVSGDAVWLYHGVGGARFTLLTPDEARALAIQLVVRAAACDKANDVRVLPPDLTTAS